MKIGTIRRMSFVLLCFTSLVFILIIQYFNLWDLSQPNTRDTMKIEKGESEKEGEEEEEKESADKWPPDRDNSVKKFKPKRKFSIKEIDEIGDKSEFFKQMFRDQDSKSLLYLNNLTYLIEPNYRSINCDLNNNKNGVDEQDKRPGLNLIIVINSKWSNFERRQRVRASWLNRDNIIESICNYQRMVSLPTLNNDGGDRGLESSGKSILPIRKVEYLFALGKPESSRKNMQQQQQQQSQQHYLHKLRNRPNIHNDDAEQIMIDSRILNEFNQSRDLLVVNLLEQYKSMSIKHLSIFKWILKSLHHHDHHTQQQQKQHHHQSSYQQQGKHNNVSHAAAGLNEKLSDENDATKRSELDDTLVLKCDDDADIDLSQLIEFYHQDKQHFQTINQLRGSQLSGSFQNINNLSNLILPNLNSSKSDTTTIKNEANWIMCARFPQDTPVFRSGSGRKWQITRSEYNFDTFPAYCSGLAYLAPLLLLKRLLILSHISLWNDVEKVYMKPLWIDDVFITGILFSTLIESDRARIVSLNAHFCYTRAHQSRRLKLNAPCMVSEVH